MRQRKRVPILVASLLAASAMALHPGLPKLPKGMHYAEARASLIARGWAPVRAPGADACQPDDSRCTGRPEMLACSGTGLASCVFLWSKAGAQIEVVTLGESDPITVSRVRCRSGC